LLAAIIAVYLALGTLYAAVTPPWQAPDEPAHYNYVRYLAEQHRFPILKPGDYPAVYLEEIKAAHFPVEMSIEPIRYEFHQPPLYYLLAVPVYRLFGGALLPLRLFSVLTGALLLLVTYWALLGLAPQRPFLALGGTAFVAFLPMHLAMTAAVNNDTLVELLLAIILLLAIRYLKEPVSSEREPSLLLLLGVTTGLGLVSKSSVYVVLPLVLAAIIARILWPGRGSRPHPRGLAPPIALYLVPAVGLALPWWARNLAYYGGLDFLGLGRHNQVVVGQLRTAQFIAEQGFWQLVRDFLLTSFRSFWGQFGWMGVLLDPRLYQGLAILSSLAAIGFALWSVGAWRRRQAFPDWQWAACAALVLWGLFTLASYVWYNTQFVQHQGRYLFRALLPMGLAVALGWREMLRRERALPLAGLLAGTGVALRLAGLLANWPVLLILAAAAGLVIRRLLPPRLDPFVHICPYLLLIPLDLACLFFYIVPQLAR